MIKWPPRLTATKRFHVKVRRLRLDGFLFCESRPEDGGDKMVSVEMVWKGPKSTVVLVPFYRSSSKNRRNRTTQKSLIGIDGGSIEWDDEFESICEFSVVSKEKDHSFGSWDASFTVLCVKGENAETDGKRAAVLGKASLDLAQLASTVESSEIERKLPVNLKVDDIFIEATLLVSVSFAEVRDSHDSPGRVHNPAESRKEDRFFRIVKGLTGNKKKQKEYEKCQKEQLSYSDSDESALFDSDGLVGNESTTTCENSSGELSSGTEAESTPSPETQLPSRLKTRLFSWKRRRLSFSSSKEKVEPLIKKTGESDELDVDQQPITCGSSQAGNFWEVKELVSRDGEAKLKANVFFASFDQRSAEAAGESACAVLVAVIAHWLHSNQDVMPTRPEFDGLITQGSSEWRKLCGDGAYTVSFPDKHFDLETVLETDLRPLKVLPEKSFTGFFSPEKFDCLKDAMSFDEIWNEISCRSSDGNSSVSVDEPRIYIVSWNDHFFVLKVESDAYYIIDSLGERLFEGCYQAYILKFDESSVIHGKAAKDEAGTTEESASRGKERCRDEVVICSGKECCREYIKRFLAAIPVGELEEQGKKTEVSTFSLHQRLQIDFHYSSSSSSSSATPSSNALS